MSFVRVARIAGALVMIILLGQMLPEQLLFPADQQPILQVTPTSLGFEGQVGGPTPDPQFLTIANTGGGLMEWHASADVDWIILGGTEGQLSGGRVIQLWVFVKPEGLEAGDHRGAITIEAPEAQGSPAVVAVTLALIPITIGKQPLIISIEFPKEIPADGSRITGKVHFKDPDGDINLISFEVIAATEFKPFSFNPYVQGLTEGAIGFFISCYTVQEVTLEVTLSDEGGNRSPPEELTFSCVQP